MSENPPEQATVPPSVRVQAMRVVLNNIERPAEQMRNLFTIVSDTMAGRPHHPAVPQVYSGVGAQFLTHQNEYIHRLLSGYPFLTLLFENVEEMTKLMMLHLVEVSAMTSVSFLMDTLVEYRRSPQYCRLKEAFLVLSWSKDNWTAAAASGKLERVRAAFEGMVKQAKSEASASPTPVEPLLTGLGGAEVDVVSVLRTFEPDFAAWVVKEMLFGPQRGRSEKRRGRRVLDEWFQSKQRRQVEEAGGVTELSPLMLRSGCRTEHPLMVYAKEEEAGLLEALTGLSHKQLMSTLTNMRRRDTEVQRLKEEQACTAGHTALRRPSSSSSATAASVAHRQPVVARTIPALPTRTASSSAAGTHPHLNLPPPSVFSLSAPQADTAVYSSSSSALLQSMSSCSGATDPSDDNVTTHLPPSPTTTTSTTSTSSSSSFSSFSSSFSSSSSSSSSSTSYSSSSSFSSSSSSSSSSSEEEFATSFPWYTSNYPFSSSSSSSSSSSASTSATLSAPASAPTAPAISAPSAFPYTSTSAYPSATASTSYLARILATSSFPSIFSFAPPSSSTSSTSLSAAASVAAAVPTATRISVPSLSISSSPSSASVCAATPSAAAVPVASRVSVTPAMGVGDAEGMRASSGGPTPATRIRLKLTMHR